MCLYVVQCYKVGRYDTVGFTFVLNSLIQSSYYDGLTNLLHRLEGYKLEHYS